MFSMLRPKFRVMVSAGMSGLTVSARALVLCTAAIVLAAATSSGSALAEDMAQLDPLAKSYTLGRFHYEGPDADGWRQVANATDSLQLVYAEQLEENKINNRCYIVMEVHDLPAEAGSPAASDLAERGRRQRTEGVKEQLAALSPIAAVPGVDNTYTYRFLLHGPPELGADYYEVYYVMLAADKSQYVIMQVNTRDLDYENQLYFQQFYATLAKLKYQASVVADAAKSAGATAATGAGEGTKPAASPAAAAAPAK